MAAAAPAVASAAHAVMTMDALMQKERAIAAASAELARRDRDVKLFLQRMLPNWPAKFCCVSPIVYHSIESEVPTDRVSFVRGMYYTYYATCVLLIYNLVCCGIAMGSQDKKEGEVPASDAGTDWTKHFGVSFVHLLGIVFAFPVWYFPIYRAASTFDRQQSSMALVGLVVALLYDAFMAVGLIGYGGAGFLFAMKLDKTKESRTPFYMGLASAVLWCVQAVVFVFALFRVRRYRRQDKDRQAGGVAGAVANAVRPGLGMVV